MRLSIVSDGKDKFGYLPTCASNEVCEAVAGQLSGGAATTSHLGYERFDRLEGMLSSTGGRHRDGHGGGDSHGNDTGRPVT
ncbi:hypothetical protein [Streptomyces sp. 6N106]|uniref:hypothetical protein n=1 Tax=Streptomyces sp. 6N106 TaxID=3457418 RepID=UPI003FD34987